jgi:hypothetical protein
MAVSDHNTYLVQILLPIRDNGGRPYAPDVLAGISKALTHQFGGVTAYSRAPAKGVWMNSDHVKHDDVIALEVMVEKLDRDWWTAFRNSLEKNLAQQEIVIRAHAIEKL